MKPICGHNDILIAGALCIFLSGMMLPCKVAGQNPDHTESRLRVSGTFRPVYSWIETRDRQGERSTTHALNARLQLRAEYHFSPQVALQSRLAGRYATDQDQMRFVLEDHTPGSGSYPSGTTTIDEFALAWKVPPDLMLIAGRFQARFPLAGFIPKGMDRYYAANLSISHTDGLWVQWDVHSRWRLHVVGSHNGTQGSSHAARAPLNFEPRRARAAGYVNLQHRRQDGLWVQREISASVLPHSFLRDGKRRSYTTISTRMVLRLPLPAGEAEYWIGGEVGFVPLAPAPASGGISVDEGRTLMGKSAVAWQVSAYGNELFRRHRIGILYGQTDPHWVVSSSFRPNNTMSEIRYRFTLSRQFNLEARYRFRTDLFKPDNAVYTRQDRDFYARFTWRF